MILVVDIQKGFETQTGECLILGEVTRKPIIVALNKIDLLEDSQRETTISKVTNRVQKTLSSTIFKNAKIIPVSASSAINLDILIKAMIDEVAYMKLVRNTKLPMIFAFDHCFSIKGSGTVLSGTVLQGTVKVNDTIEFPQLKTDRKIKSIQMFRNSVESGECGDRLGVCVTNFDPKLLERGMACQKGCVQEAFAVIVKLNRIRYFKRDIKTKAKFHCSVGHETVMGNIILFSSPDASEFSWENVYKYEEDFNENPENFKSYFALIEFEHPVLVHNEMLLIGSKLDTELSNVCRLAFHGKILLQNSSVDKNYQQTFLPNLKIFKTKTREGTIQRVVNDHEIISSNLFKKETDRSKFVRMKCQLSTGENDGTISGTFGQSSKVRIEFDNPLQPSTLELLKTAKNNIKVTLTFKKFIFDKNHKMIQ